VERQKIFKGGPFANVGGPLAKHSEKKLRNNGEPGCRYWLKKRKRPKNQKCKKQQPTENQKNSKYQNAS